MSLIISTTNGEQFTIKKNNAVRLELELNKSEYAREWIELGNFLFDVSLYNSEIDENIEVTIEQYNLLENWAKLFHLLQ